MKSGQVLSLAFAIFFEAMPVTGIVVHLLPPQKGEVQVLSQNCRQLAVFLIHYLLLYEEK